jgi:hypothetical protein
MLPIPMAVQSNEELSDRLVAGIAGPNPAEGIDVRLLCLLCIVVCCVGSGRFDGLITRAEECYRVCVCDLGTSTRRPRLVLRAVAPKVIEVRTLFEDYALSFKV